MKNIKFIIDDGFCPEFVEGASFDGIFEIPHIPAPKEASLPTGMIPFTKRKYSKKHSEFVVFYEHDLKFRDILVSPQDYMEELKLFPGIISPDCSLYRDMPLTLQIANVYMNRAIGYYFWKQGLYTIPNVRWGDERSYTTSLFTEPFAFQGVDKHSIVSIGTYGCVKGSENKLHFKAGLAAMLDYLEPETVLVYGSMPDDIFSDYIDRTNFVRFDDWTKVKKSAAMFEKSLRDIPIIENGELVGYSTCSDLF